MNGSNGGLRLLVLRVKPGAKPSAKKIPRKLFLGFRFKGRPAATCPLPKTEDQK